MEKECIETTEIQKKENTYVVPSPEQAVGYQIAEHSPDSCGRRHQGNCNRNDNRYGLGQAKKRLSKVKSQFGTQMIHMNGTNLHH